MKKISIASLMLATTTLYGCGEPTVIDQMKELSVAQCPDVAIGDLLLDFMVVNFDDTVVWGGEYIEDTGKYRLYGEGGVQFVGQSQTARLYFDFDQAAQAVELSSLTLNGSSQPYAQAEALIIAMCESYSS